MPIGSVPHDKLIHAHVTIANALSSADRVRRPCAYKFDTLTALFARGKYSLKESRRKLALSPQDEPPVLHMSKRARIVNQPPPRHRCVSPVRVHILNMNTTPQRWKLDKEDDIYHCAEVQLCSWLSIHRHHALRCDTQHHCITRPLVLHYVPTPAPPQLTNPYLFC